MKESIAGELECLEVVVEAPASIANLGPGFDILAMAIELFSDRVRLCVRDGVGEVYVRVHGYRVPRGRDNVVYSVVKEFIKRYGFSNLDYYIELYKGVPVSCGLGSSGASAAAISYALSILLKQDLGSGELVELAGYGESTIAGTPHYDNVSASLFGGIVLVDPSKPRVYKLCSKTDFWINIVIPRIDNGHYKTFNARKILPKEISLKDHVRQIAIIARVIHALEKGDLEEFGEAVSTDYIVEPHRSKLIPGYWILKKIALESGALGFNIAGAGPSVFSIHDSRESARKTGLRLVNHLNWIGVKAVSYTTRVSSYGARVIG